MIKINNFHIRNRLLKYLDFIENKQNSLVSEEELFYCIIHLPFLLENKLFNLDVLCHPLTGKVKKFYEDSYYISSILEYSNLLLSIILYELNSNEDSFLNYKQLKKVIKEYESIK